MFQDRRKLRRLKKEVDALDEAYAAQFRAAKTEDDYLEVKGEYEAVGADDICKLECFKTHLIRKRAARFDLNIPPFEEYWHIYPHTQTTYLSERGTAKMSGKITRARFAYWKRWIDIVAPTASVLISLFALVLAGIALYLQISGALSVQQ